MNVEEIMSKSLITVKMDDKLKAVKVIFDNANIHHLLVVEADKLFGVVSDRDMLKFQRTIMKAIETSSTRKSKL